MDENLYYRIHKPLSIFIRIINALCCHFHEYWSLCILHSIEVCQYHYSDRNFNYTDKEIAFFFKLWLHWINSIRSHEASFLCSIAFCFYL